MTTDTKPGEAADIIRGFLQCPEIADCAPEDMDDETRDLERRARKFLVSRLAPTAGVVKPLEWNEITQERSNEDPRRETSGWEAITVFGTFYGIDITASDYSVVYDYTVIGRYETEAEAKAAAFADYSQRILSALSPPTAEAVEPVARDLVNELLWVSWPGAVEGRFKRMHLDRDGIEKAAAALSSERAAREQAERERDEARRELAEAVGALKLAANRLDRISLDYAPGTIGHIERTEWTDEARDVVKRLSPPAALGSSNAASPPSDLMERLRGVAAKVAGIELDLADFDGDRRGHYAALEDAHSELTDFIRTNADAIVALANGNSNDGRDGQT